MHRAPRGEQSTRTGWGRRGNSLYSSIMHATLETWRFLSNFQPDFWSGWPKSGYTRPSGNPQTEPSSAPVTEFWDQPVSIRFFRLLYSSAGNCSGTSRHRRNWTLKSTGRSSTNAEKLDHAKRNQVTYRPTYIAGRTSSHGPAL